MVYHISLETIAGGLKTRRKKMIKILDITGYKADGKEAVVKLPPGSLSGQARLISGKISGAKEFVTTNEVGVKLTSSGQIKKRLMRQDIVSGDVEYDFEYGLYNMVVWHTGPPTFVSINMQKAAEVGFDGWIEISVHELITLAGWEIVSE